MEVFYRLSSTHSHHTSRLSFYGGVAIQSKWCPVISILECGRNLAIILSQGEEQSISSEDGISKALYSRRVASLQDDIQIEQREVTDVTDDDLEIGRVELKTSSKKSWMWRMLGEGSWDSDYLDRHMIWIICVGRNNNNLNWYKGIIFYWWIEVFIPPAKPPSIAPHDQMAIEWCSKWETETHVIKVRSSSTARTSSHNSILPRASIPATLLQRSPSVPPLCQYINNNQPNPTN